MALRVLLADESVTIKKVFQLALQDFAVDVHSVTVGVDVLNVALKYKPDIVFADVLLQKKNGYEVCRDIKNSPELSRTPVVLIWSGFMELDDAKYKASGANAHLEKPFDTQRLRQIVQTLVAKTKSQPLSDYLSFPKLPDFDEAPTTKEIPLPPRSVAMPPPTPVPNASGGFEPEAYGASDNSNSWSMDHFAEPLPAIPTEAEEEFQPLNLVRENTRPTFTPPKAPTATPLAPLNLDDEVAEEEPQWVQKTLTKYKLDPNKAVEAPPKISYQVPEEKINPDTLLTNAWARPATPNTVDTSEPELEDEFELELNDEPVTSIQAKPTTAPQLNEKQLEEVIRAQSKEVIEKVVWQIVPEIATRIIERELERLLAERQKK
jgi:CheY-like chemotaxis protein